ncbi:MAG: hypothetical protein HRU15_12650 [Planctomycetes bacterium]|nr:hypothetical protein [Planctomycetota bacterium]
MHEKGLTEEFILKNIQTQNKPHIYHSKPKLLRNAQFKSLSHLQKEVFKEIFHLREQFAKELNLPPNSIIENVLLPKLVTQKVALTVNVFGNRVPLEKANEMVSSFLLFVNKLD